MVSREVLSEHPCWEGPSRTSWSNLLCLKRGPGKLAQPRCSSALEVPRAGASTTSRGRGFQRLLVLLALPPVLQQSIPGSDSSLPPFGLSVALFLQSLRSLLSLLLPVPLLLVATPQLAVGKGR